MTDPFHDKAQLAALKDWLTVPLVWQRLGLPGAPRKSCRSPFREDRKPSFSIYDNDRRWADHSTGEKGDAIDFLARACGLPRGEALRRYRAMGGLVEPPASLGKRLIHRPTKYAAVLPPLHAPSFDETGAVARSRGLHPAAVALATRLGTLAFGEVCGFPCWILTDQSKLIAEARRIDRQPFPPQGELGQRKAHTLRGSSKSWPVGLALLKRLPHFRALMLLEGGPDYLAALHFCLEQDIHDVLPIAMLGRGVGAKIHPEALSLLKGRRIRLCPHNDADGGGMTAAQMWATQLNEHGCTVDFCGFKSLVQADGSPVNDLNEAVFTAPSHAHKLTRLFP